METLGRIWKWLVGAAVGIGTLAMIIWYTLTKKREASVAKAINEAAQKRAAADVHIEASNRAHEISMQLEAEAKKHGEDAKEAGAAAEKAGQDAVALVEAGKTKADVLSHASAEEVVDAFRSRRP